MDGVKSLTQSRTFWSALFALIACVAGVFNLSTVVGIVSDPTLVDKALFIVGSIGSIAAIFFRSKATAVIGSPSP